MFANHRVFLAVALSAGLLSGTAGLTAGCAGPAAAPPATSAAPGLSPTAGLTAGNAGAGGFSATDNAWIEVNIAMNEQILPLLDLAPAHGSNPQLKALAADLTKRFGTELDDLRRLHGEAGLPTENPHLGMPMPGMVTPDQVTEAAAKTGAPFDVLLRQHVKEHWTQSEMLLGSLMKLDSPQPIVDLAIRMKSNRDYIRYTLADIPEN
ncbi:putative outer membrane protein [Actinoplanes lutulentus]|uniref:DUF305 domain-containing protein n=1 Tax=Actinoplanes lutulentus TaxID=1287878 RepID=A0A327Z5Q3_9ACTN|nr:DUF305 domain-containing protein [Actinoplanes lutulentus]MBB2947487.1 putative outer membrane protein [Actinoplanes lutulentus]RAK28093.1 protein of unknown function (DUF305) [Actinoplanes lutulentus]